MATSVRYGLARSYQLSGNLTATVTDAGGAGRSVTIALSGKWVRPVIADPAGTGTSTYDPFELFTRAGAQLSVGAAGGTWSVTLHTDGRTKVTWTGTGTGEITAGGLLAALGFGAGGTGSLASGSSAYSLFPALGLILFAYSQDDTGWQPENDAARAEDAMGRTFVYRSTYVRYRRRLRAYWVPRSWTDNTSGEYFTPCWSIDIASAGLSTASAPDYNTTATEGGWVDWIFSCSGQIEWGFSESVTTYLDGGNALGVYLSPSMWDPERISPTATATTYGPRRDVLVEMTKVRSFSS